MTSVGDETLFPFDEAEQLRLEERQFWLRRAREQVQPLEAFTARAPCPGCETTHAYLIRRNGQNCVYCSACGRHLFNAPKVETGERPRTVRTVRKDIKPSQQASILDRDHGRCVLCGRSDVP